MLSCTTCSGWKHTLMLTTWPTAPGSAAQAAWQRAPTAGAGRWREVRQPRRRGNGPACGPDSPKKTCLQISQRACRERSFFLASPAATHVTRHLKCTLLALPRQAQGETSCASPASSQQRQAPGGWKAHKGTTAPAEQAGFLADRSASSERGNSSAGPAHTRHADSRRQGTSPPRVPGPPAPPSPKQYLHMGLESRVLPVELERLREGPSRQGEDWARSGCEGALRGSAASAAILAAAKLGGTAALLYARLPGPGI